MNFLYAISDYDYDKISKLYVTLLGRVSEVEGNKYWGTLINKDINFIANAILNTDEAKEYFGEALNDNRAFIEFIYKNTFNITYEQYSKNIDYWIEMLNNGSSKGEVVNGIIYYFNDTDYEYFGNYTLLEVKLETGRKNQIRLHFSEMG